MATEPIADAMLAEWESLAGKATEGPRIVARHDNYDARLFKVARTAVLTLAAEVRRQRGMVDRLVGVALTEGICPPSECLRKEGRIPYGVCAVHLRAWAAEPIEEAKP